MRRILLKQTVPVWNQLVEIILWKKSKTVWEAVGYYMGETIRTKGASASAAVKQWQEVARQRRHGDFTIADLADVSICGSSFLCIVDGDKERGQIRR